MFSRGGGWQASETREGIGGKVEAMAMANVLTSQTALDDQVIRADTFLGKGMLEDAMTAEEVKVMRQTEVVEVTLHGQTTEMVSVEGLEERFQQERGDARVTIPSRDILVHQRKAGLTLDVTSKDVLEELTRKFQEIFDIKDEKIKKEETKLDVQLQDLADQKQTPEVTANNIAQIFINVVLIGSVEAKKIEDVKRKIEREVLKVLKEGDMGSQKSGIMKELRSILRGGVENQLLTKDTTTKSKWGAVNNLRGGLGENKVALAMNQALDDFMGMSVSGLKTFTHLWEFLDKLNIDLTHKNTKNPITGKTLKTAEVELDNVSTWLEEDTLVMTVVESKTSELKPWTPLDPTRRDQAATRHAKDALLQLVKCLRTVKDIFPDILETTMGKVR